VHVRYLSILFASALLGAVSAQAFERSCQGHFLFEGMWGVTVTAGHVKVQASAAGPNAARHRASDRAHDCMALHFQTWRQGHSDRCRGITDYTMQDRDFTCGLQRLCDVWQQRHGGKADWDGGMTARLYSVTTGDTDCGGRRLIRSTSYNCFSLRDAC
jgi:hypothetical protein